MGSLTIRRFHLPILHTVRQHIDRSTSNIAAATRNVICLFVVLVRRQSTQYESAKNYRE